MNIKVCLDYKRYKSKNKAKGDVKIISSRISDYETEISLVELVHEVGIKGKTFAPALFYGNREKECFKEMQIFCLDFDKGNLSCVEIMERGKLYGLPVVFIYETLSSSDRLHKYRVGFVHIVPVEHSDIALFILNMLKKIFPEADRNCFELSRMFFGGKGVIYYDESEPVFRVDELAHYYQIYSKEHDPHHFASNQKAVLKDIKFPGLDKNNLFTIDTYSNGRRVCGEFIEDVKDDKNCENMHTSNIYTIELNNISQKIVFTPLIYQEDKCEKKKRSYIANNVASDTISKFCLLWKEYINGIHLPYEERFILATNAIHIRGLEKVFLKVLYENYDSYHKWKYYIDYFKSRSFHPTSCSSCPYCDECIHEENMVLTVSGRKNIVRVEEEPPYVSVEEAYRQVYEALYTSVSAPDNRVIYLIKAQTSIGKTHAFVDMIKNRNSGKPILIATPLISLKEEIVKRLPAGEKEQILSWEQLCLPEDTMYEVKKLYSEGSYKEAKKVIKEFFDKTENGIIKEEGNQYLKALDILKKADKNMVITHARLRTIPSDILAKYEIIIDEDILFSQLRSTGTISTEDVCILLHSGKITGERAVHIKKMIASDETEYFRCGSKEDQVYMTLEEKNRIGVEGDVNGFLSADVFYRVSDDSGDKFVFCKMPWLPNQNVTILSATLDEGMYQMFFKNRHIVMYDIAKAKYQGRLIQYTNYSLSKKNINELCEKTQMSVEELYGFIKSYCGEFKYGITYLKYEHLLGERHLHFGNAIGVDKYNGKTGLIIGTQFLNEESYKLVGFMLGVDVSKHTMSFRRVTYAGYEFPLTTYCNEILQKIHLYFLSSEMEQCVGRSRLLRKNAKVYLFSSFPCEQAEINTIDYMKEKIASVSEDTPE